MMNERSSLGRGRRAREREWSEVRGERWSRSEVIEVRGRTLAVTTSGDDEGAAEPRW